MTDAVDSQISDAVRRAVSAGINVIDTASNYRDGRTEKIIGIALRDLFASGNAARDELYIASKGGYLPLNPGGDNRLAIDYLETIGCPAVEGIVDGCHCLDPTFLAFQLKESLGRLGLSTLDLFYLHNPEVQLRAVDRDVFRARLRSSFTFLEAMCADGQIARYGIATWHGLRVPADHPLSLDPDELYTLARDAAGSSSHHLAALQAPCSPLMPELLMTKRLHRGQARFILEIASELELRVFASSAIGQGKPIDSVRPMLSQALLATGKSDVVCALQFVRSLPYITSALVGMKQPNHIEELLALTSVSPLTSESLMAP